MRTKTLVWLIVSLAALLLAAAWWLSSDSPSSPAAPRLTESFAVLGCHPGPAGAKGCAEHHVLVLDATINRLRAEIVNAAPYEARAFIAGERRWYASRERRCGSATGVESLARSACLISQDELHVGVLVERLGDATS